MSFRIQEEQHVVGPDGLPYKIVIIDNPLIDDVLMVEAQLSAADTADGVTRPGYRVDRDVRDVLLRLGVER